MSEMIVKVESGDSGNEEIIETLASGTKSVSTSNNWQFFSLTIDKSTEYTNYKKIVCAICIDDRVIQYVPYDVIALKTLKTQIPLITTDYTGETGYFTNEQSGYALEIAFTIDSTNKLSKAVIVYKNTMASHTLKGRVYGIK